VAERAAKRAPDGKGTGAGKAWRSAGGERGNAGEGGGGAWRYLLGSRRDGGRRPDRGSRPAAAREGVSGEDRTTTGRERGVGEGRAEKKY
jgi:hypothetical protein